MKLALWDDMQAMERRLDQTLHDVFTGKPLTLWPPRLNTQVTPSSNVFVRGEDLVIQVELPGVDPQQDIAVTIEDGDLVVKGTRTDTQEVKEQDYYRKEVWHGAFQRRVPLPDGVTEDAIEATYERGMLEVTVHGAAAAPVEEPKAPPRRIRVTIK